MSSSLLSERLDFVGGSGERSRPKQQGRYFISLDEITSPSHSSAREHLHQPSKKSPQQGRRPAKKVKLTNAAPAGDGEGGNEEIKSIFVDKLFWNVDNDRVAHDFASCGEVVSTTVAIDRNTGQLRGCGHVHFAAAAAVEAALKMNGTEIDGRAVNIDYGRPEDRSEARENGDKAFGDTASEPSTTLFVSNLSFTLTEDAAWSFFSGCGARVKSARLPTDCDTGRPKGLGASSLRTFRREGCKRRRRRTGELWRGRTGWGPWRTRRWRL
ncbi:Single-stranded dna binding protein [Mycena sanguinolenta]|uniref:Single-stranded dna binding protein n=1 Tax=Mycena sanguinolenta TaxID=230812 RepID=A0A8H7CY13_9AGAR|nr:Single-stranded dna binding protein [Mycena sanguinolenta]